MSGATFLWLCFSTLIGYLIGAHFEHPYVGLGVGFVVGLFVRYVPKLIMEGLDILSDIF